MTTNNYSQYLKESLMLDGAVISGKTVKLFYNNFTQKYYVEAKKNGNILLSTKDFDKACIKHAEIERSHASNKYDVYMSC